MREKPKIFTAMLVVMTALGMVGGLPAASAAPGDHATVSVVHGVPGATVDVHVDGALVVDDFEPEEIAGPLVLTGESHDVEVKSSDGTSTIIGPVAFDLTGGGNFTIVAHLDETDSPVLTAFVNTYEDLDEGTSQVVVRHTAAAPAVDVLDAADNSVLIENLANGDEDSLTLPAGSYDVAVTATGTTAPAVIESNVELEAGTKYYVYAIGSLGAMTVTAIVDTWTGFTTATDFAAALSGDDEVPPVETDAAGLATFEIGDEAIDYSLFTFGLADVVGAHIHVGDPGANGGVAVDLLGIAAVSTPAVGDGLLAQGTITPDDVAALPDAGFDGSWDELVRLMRTDPAGLYVNVHSSANPSGEIRGQVDALDVPPEPAFTDTEGSVHAANIALIGAAGITRGCNPPANDRYCPSESITRGQMAAFLARAFNLPASDEDLFTDDEDSIFEGDINAIAAVGITQGCNPPTNDQFCPDDAIDRGQMAAFLKRAFGLDASMSDQFTDDDDSVFEGDIDAIADAGITQGCNPPTSDNYCPDDEVTRAQMASFLARAFGWGS